MKIRSGRRRKHGIYIQPQGNVPLPGTANNIFRSEIEREVFGKRLTNCKCQGNVVFTFQVCPSSS